MTYKTYTYTAFAGTELIAGTSGVSLLVTSLKTNEQGQYNNLRLTVAWSTSPTIVSAVTIKIPSGFTMISEDCMLDYDSSASSTDFEISKCVIDTTTNIMTIVIYAVHSSSTNLIVKTRYNGMVNPSVDVDLSTFEVHTYAISSPVHTSDEGVIFKGTGPSSTFTVTSAIGTTKPDYIEIVDLPYSDHTYSNAANSYFFLKFGIVPTLAVTGYINVEYNTADISIDSPVTVNDIQDNELLCLIDDVRYSCSFTAGIITIASVTLSSGTTYRIAIGLTNIFSSPSRAYLITGLTAQSSKYHTDMRIKIYDGSNTLQLYGENRHLIIQEQVFQSAAIDYMTKATSAKNLLSFKFNVGSVAFDTLLFEFPIKNEQGDTVFSANLGNFVDGGEVPCETLISDSARPYCYFKIGVSSDFGTPAYVVMKNIPSYTTNTQYEFIIAGFSNPSADGTKVSVKVYGFSSSTFVGFQEFSNFFTTVAATASSSTTLEQFSVAFNSLNTATVTLGVSIAANSYILIEDTSSNNAPHLMITAATSGSPIVRRMFGIDSGTSDRKVFYAVKFSSALSAGTYTISNVFVDTFLNLILYHYTSDKLAGEIVTTTTSKSTSAQDCITISASPLEVCRQENAVSTYAFLSLSYTTASCGSMSVFTFNENNILVITLDTLITTISSCYVADGLTPANSAAPIICSVSSNVLTITGWSDIESSNTLKIFLSASFSGLGSTGDIIVKFYSDSNSLTNASPFISSSASAISWPAVSAISEDITVSNLLIDPYNNLISFDATNINLANFQFVYVTFSNQISVSALASGSCKYQINGGSDNYWNTVWISSGKNVQASISLVSITSTDTINVYLATASSAITCPSNNIFFVKIEFEDDTSNKKGKTLIAECSTTSAPSVTVSSLAKYSSCPTELSLTFNSNPSFSTTLWDRILIELASEWSFITTSGNDDFDLPCIDSSGNALNCYGHIGASYPLKSITISQTSSISSGFTIYIANIVTPSSGAASTGINIKFMNSGNFIPLSGYIPSVKSTNVLYTSMNIVLTDPASSDTGTLAVVFDFSALTFTISSYTTGGANLASNSVIYIEFSELNIAISSAATWGNTINHFYLNSYAIVANLNDKASGGTSTSAFSSVSFSLPSKIYKGTDFTLRVRLYDDTGDLLSKSDHVIIASTVTLGN